MSAAENTKDLASLIFHKTGKAVLDTQEASEILGISIRTLEKDRAEGTGIPYTRLNGKERGKPLYSILDIAKTIEDNKQKTLN